MTRTTAGLDSGSLRRIPGVGPSIEADLVSLGHRTVESLRSADPQDLYDRLCTLTKTRQDPCVLYVFRCAVYYATTPTSAQDAEQLKWWNWTDARMAERACTRMKEPVQRQS